MKILFVCTGNICRSPTAEGVLRHHLQQQGIDRIIVDSAGIQGYHVGETPDHRSIQTAQDRGVSLLGQTARRVDNQDFYEFDLILAMDQSHYQQLQYLMPDDTTAEIALFLEYSNIDNQADVPDPYYGSQRDFDYAFELIEDASQKLIEKLQSGKQTTS